MKILVTGAAGWIATWLIRDLLAAGHSVIGVDCAKLDEERREFIGADFEFRRMDLFHYLSGQMPKVDVVVPLTGELGSVESVEKPMASLRNGVVANLVLLDKIVETDWRPLVVFVSSDLCYRKPSRCFYSLHKKTVEGYLRICNTVHDLPYVILRMATGYGPLQKRKSVVNFYVRRALEGETIPVYGDGKNRQAFIYIEDAVRCIRMACEGEFEPNSVYPLVGDNLRIVGLAGVVSEMLGGEIEHGEWPVVAEKVNVGDLPIDLPFLGDWYPRVGIYAGVERTAKWMKKER